MFTLFALLVGFSGGFAVCWIYRDRLKAKADALVSAVEK